MTQALLSELADWELLDEDQDLRGRMLLDRRGRPVGMILDMLVDIDTEQVEAILVDGGAEYPLRDVQLLGRQPVLTTEVEGAAGHRGAAETRPTLDEPARRVEPAGGVEAAGVVKPAGVVELAEEELDVRTRQAEAGRVEVRKEVVAEHKTVEVPIVREEVVVERRWVTPRPTDRGFGDEQRVTLRLHQEHVTVEKVPVVIEEVRVGKRVTAGFERVSETVRREELVVETTGDLEADGPDGARGRPKPPLL